MTASAVPPDELAAWVLAQGREGRSRVEIASALGMTRARLRALAEDDEALAEALALADEAAEAWWMSLPRALLMSGKGQAAAVWRAAVAYRFGTDGAEGAPPADKSRGTVVIIPDNGRQRWRGHDHDVEHWESQLAEAEDDLERARERLEAVRANVARDGALGDSDEGDALRDDALGDDDDDLSEERS
jgi:hypothetical protein